MSLRFGEFELDQERRQLLRSGRAVPLEPKSYEVLTLLLERRPRALSRPVIRDVVWPGVFISESTLTRAINSIREALDDDSRDPRFIRTVHGFGYAFCGEAREATAGQPQTGTGTARESETSPYPGLSAFAEADAALFHGREVEVAELWDKIQRRKLLAVIGPSGVGKTSFLRAGVIPKKPDGWTTTWAAPGSSAVSSLAHALVPGLAGDAAAIQELFRAFEGVTLRGEFGRACQVVRRWLGTNVRALVVVDQFEELFTLNSSEVQATFAELLGCLVIEGGIHVLLAMRDDFLFRCQAHEALRPVFADLTPLGPLSDHGLRLALVQPALDCGYRFEDEALVDGMLIEVGRERGALPMLAFAASRMWEGRDPECGLLTREAYERIGGVTGALAQHAEATLRRIGPQRMPMVREVFRNLVTAQGTRAVRDKEELLSVFAGRAADGPFDDRGDADASDAIRTESSRRRADRAIGSRVEAESVLAQLVDARLLTSFERADDGGAGRHQDIEIIHESLLAAWPRLVRWRTQEADGVQLRDQLRQAARLWHDRGQPHDLLWSGTAYRDFTLWRERYEAPLTASEDAFAAAMHQRAARQRRQRQAVVAGLVGTAAAVAILTTLLWQRADAQRRSAEAQTLRAEASSLLALGQIEIDRHPTAAAAYALKSLELVDTLDARLFALRALQRGPTASLTPVQPADNGAMSPPTFSPDGEWLAFAGWTKVELFRRSGAGPLSLGGDKVARGHPFIVGFGPRSDVVASNRLGEVRLWSLPDGRELRSETLESGSGCGIRTSPQGFVTYCRIGPRSVLRQHTLDPPRSDEIGSFIDSGVSDINALSGLRAFAHGRRVYLQPLADLDSPPSLLAQQPRDVVWVAFSPDGRRLAVADGSGQTRVWEARTPADQPLAIVRTPGVTAVYPDATGRWLAGHSMKDGQDLWQVWDLTAPWSARPLELRRADAPYWLGLAFEPTSRWLATSNSADGTLWSLDGSFPWVLSAHQAFVNSLAFTPEGDALVSASNDGTLRWWPLGPSGEEESRVVLKTDLFFPTLAVDASSRSVVLSTNRGPLLRVPLGGGPALELPRACPTSSCPIALAGDLLALAPLQGAPEDRAIRILQLGDGSLRVLTSPPGVFDRPGSDSYDSYGLAFLGQRKLYVTVLHVGLLEYDLGSGAGRLVASQPQGGLAIDSEGRLGVGVTSYPEFVLAGEPGELVRFRFDGTPPQTLRSHGTLVGAVALDPTGTVVATGSVDGTVRIGFASGEEPYVFFGHEGVIWKMAFSPDGRFVASGGNDGTIRLWPVPDLTAPPPHTLPRERFLAGLRSRTNLRVVPDSRSATGWKIDRGPFPGWGREPEW